MKKSTKLLSVILAIVMLFSSFGVTSFAAMTKFDVGSSDVYDSNDKGQTYLLTDEQRANYIMDMLDGLLKSANLDMGSIAGVRIDLRSIDAVGDTLSQRPAILAGPVWNRLGTVNTFYNIGIIAELSLEGASRLDRDGGTSDVTNIANLVKVLNDSAVRIGQIFTKGASLGKIAIAGVDIPAITGNIPGFLKRMLAPLGNFYLNFGEDANPAYPNKIATAYTNDAAGYNQADAEIVLDTFVKDILVKLLTMPRKGVYITDKSQNKFSADVANAKFVHTEKVVDIKGIPVLNEQGIQVENFYVYLDALGNAVESTDQAAVQKKYTKRYLEHWDPSSIIDANFDKTLIDFKSTSLLKIVNTFAPEIFNQLAYPALNGVLRWTLLKWAGVAVHNITQLDAAGKFTPEHTAAYNLVKPYLDMPIAQFETLANTDSKVSGTQEWLFVEINGVKYQVYAPSKKQDSVSIATYTADPATTTAIYDLGNWDYQIGKWESLYTWDAGAAVENINIVPHASDIIGKIIKAALPNAPWVMADNNAQASQNLNGIVKYILKADPIKIFGEGTVLPGGFDNFTTEQTLVTITKILINKLLPTVTLGDDVTTLEECAVYAIREFTADILPQFGKGWDAKITAAKSNSNKDDAFLDILLNMGASIGVYYLREFVGFGSVNNNGALVATSIKWGPDFTWEAIFNDILNWFLSSYAKGLTSTLRSSASYTAAMNAGDAKALVNTIVNTVFPTEIKLLARPGEATFDFTTFFTDFRALLNGEITTLFSRLYAKPDSLEGKGIADIVVAFLNDIVIGTGLGGDPHWNANNGDNIMTELNKAAASATPLNSLVTKNALENIVRNLIYVLNGKQALWIQDALTLVMMFTGAVDKMVYKGASQMIDKTSFAGAENFTVNGTFTMNAQGIIESTYPGADRTGKLANGSPYSATLTRVVVESKDGQNRTETQVNAPAAANQVVAFTAQGVATAATKLYTVTTYYKVKLPDGTWLGGGAGTELEVHSTIVADSRASDKEGYIQTSGGFNGRLNLVKLSKIWYIDENMSPQSAQQNPALTMQVQATDNEANLNMNSLEYHVNAAGDPKYVYGNKGDASWTYVEANQPDAAASAVLKVRDGIVPFHNKAMYDFSNAHGIGKGENQAAWAKSADRLLWDVDAGARREDFPSDFTSFAFNPLSLRTSWNYWGWKNADVPDAEKENARSTIIMFNSYGLNALVPNEMKIDRSAKDYTPETWAAYEQAFNNALTLVYGPRDYKNFIQVNYTDNGNQSKFKTCSAALNAAIKGLVAAGKGADAAGTMTEAELRRMEELRAEVIAVSKGITSYRDYALYSYKKFEKEYNIVVDAADWVAKPSGVAPNKLVNDAMSDAEITNILNGITDPKLKTIAAALKTAPTAKETLDAQNRLDSYNLKPPTVNVNDITVSRGNAERYKNALLKGSYDRYYLTEAVNKAKAAVAGANANLYTPESVALLNKTIATAENCPVLQSEHQANRYYVLRALKNLVPVGKEASFTELNNAIAKAKSYLALIDTSKPVTKASADLLAALGLKVNYTDGAGVAQTYFIGGDTCAVSVAEHKGEYSAIKSQAYVDSATERINVALRNMFALIPEKDTQNQDKSTVAQNDLVVAGVNPSTIMDANELKALVKLENIPAGINATVEPDFSSNGGAMGTGTKLNVKVGSDIALTYALVIYGDINGDGNIDGLDAFASNKIVNSFKKVTGAYAKAADTNNDGMINAADYAAINGELAGTAITQKK